MFNTLLLSNSTMPGAPFFQWPRPWVKEFLGPKKKQLVFVPFAAVTLSWDEYERLVKEAFHDMGYAITSLHHVHDKAKAILDADGIVVGGGNTFALLSQLYQEDILGSLRAKVMTGTPY